MNTRENVIYNILKRLNELNENEELKKNKISSMEYLYAKVYKSIKPKRLNNILNNKAKKISLKELDCIAKALHMSTYELFKENQSNFNR